MLTQGQPIPNITLNNQDDTPVSLSDFNGQKIVLFFYPKDNTPGCTKEAQGFTALKADFDAQSTVILGISKDSVKSHQNFSIKCELGVTLLSDPEGLACEAFGVWQEKKNYGKTYMGIVRSTFLIDEQGKLLKSWSPVKVPGHVEAVLEAVKAS